MQAVIGTASETTDQTIEDPWTRLYRAHGKVWVGTDTDDAVDLCSDECLAVYTKRWLETGNPDRYVGLPRYGVLPTLDIDREVEPRDVPTSCAVCHGTVEVPLTDFGLDYVSEAVEEALFYPQRFGDNIEEVARWADMYPEARYRFIHSDYYRAATHAYVRAALWTAGLTGSPEDIEPDDDLLDFIWSNVGELVGLKPAFVGAHFWLSRNQEGIGFCTYGSGTLQAAAESFGPRQLLEVDGQLVFD